jgi:hypothetical protein
VDIGLLPIPRAHPAPDQELRAFVHMGLSLLLHVGLLAVSAASIPAMGEPEPGAPQESARYLLEHAFADVAEREEEEPPATTPAPEAPDGRARVPSRCGELRGGSMGKPSAPEQAGRYGVLGPVDNPDPHIASKADLPGAWPAWGFRPVSALWSFVDLYDPHAGGDPDAPTAPWGRDETLGNDPSSARGSVWGHDIAEAHGSPGAGLGRHELCETCGDMGAGAAADPAAAPGAEDAPPAGCLGLLLLTD